VTDDRADVRPEWARFLNDVARESGHELRNSLNGLVINLEVVRARSSDLDQSVRTFLAQAIEQADQTSRLAEATIALLNMVVTAIDDSGKVRARSLEGGAVEIEADGSEAERVVRNLAILSERMSLAADVSDGTVILSIPERTPDSNRSE
jgi:His Kinase A (phosphoacceptor) domain.